MKGRPNGIEGPWLGLRAAFPQGRLAAGVARTGGVGAGRPGHHPHGRCGRTEAGRGQPVRAGVPCDHRPPPHPFASLSPVLLFVQLAQMHSFVFQPPASPVFFVASPHGEHGTPLASPWRAFSSGPWGLVKCQRGQFWAGDEGHDGCSQRTPAYGS